MSGKIGDLTALTGEQLLKAYDDSVEHYDNQGQLYAELLRRLSAAPQVQQIMIGKNGQRMMVDKNGEIHEYCAECMGSCYEYTPTSPAGAQARCPKCPKCAGMAGNLRYFDDGSALQECKCGEVTDHPQFFSSPSAPQADWRNLSVTAIAAENPSVAEYISRLETATAAERYKQGGSV